MAKIAAFLDVKQGKVAAGVAMGGWLVAHATGSGWVATAGLWAWGG